MEILIAGERRALNESVQLIRKLRWIGMDDEAEQIAKQLIQRRFQPAESVVAGLCETD
jgi:streptomycin 6-kinase